MLAGRCVELIDTQAAGILLVDPERKLRVVAASSEQARLIELFQVQNDEGPCLDAYSSGVPVIHAQLRETVERWPRFTPYAVGAGFESVCALPLRLRGTVIGALNLFRTSGGDLSDADIGLAQALADVATLAILHAEAALEAERRDQQLQHALDSRVVIEQAKGMLAEQAHIDMATAFQRIRAYARHNNRQLTSVAAAIVSGDLVLDARLTNPTRPRRR